MRGVLLVCLILSGCSALRAGSDGPRAGSLGASTSAPSEDLALALDLPTGVRPQGRVIDELQPGGPAHKAGLSQGSVILDLDGVDLFSADDLNDVLKVHGPGAAVPITFQRPGERDRVETRITLGTGAAMDPTAMTWQFVSLGQLERAAEAARAADRSILVGLSGADT